MQTFFYPRFNDRKNSVDVTLYNAGYMLRINCEKWENGLIATRYSQDKLDMLAVDNPLRYVNLALNGKMQNWLDEIDGE